VIITLDEFFLSYETSRPFFDQVRVTLDSIGPTEIRVSKSQIAFWRRKAVARVWIPAKYLKREAAPLVLTLGFDHRIDSPRWKEVVEPTPGQFTHHLELWVLSDLDDQVCTWLEQAWWEAA
jgi:hypothetical protein